MAAESFLKPIVITDPEVIKELKEELEKEPAPLPKGKCNDATPKQMKKLFEVLRNPQA